MATDTAFALGILTLVGGWCPPRIRIFLLTVVILDDIAALIVIAFVYTDDLSALALLVAVALFGVVLVLRRARVRHGVAYFVVGLGVWIAMLASGVHATIAGVVMGLLATAYPPSRQALQRAGALVAAFPRGADPRVHPIGQQEPGHRGLAERATPVPVPPVDELRGRPPIRARQRRRSDQRLSFVGQDLEDAKLGILSAALLASCLAWIVFRVIEHLPRRLLVAGEDRVPAPLEDLAAPVDPDIDHVRGPGDAPVSLVEYGDFECPHCGRAEPAVRGLLQTFQSDVRFVFRHLPLRDVHEHAQLAGEASEAAGAQGMFWEMHDVLYAHQDALGFEDLLGYARNLGLDADRFSEELQSGRHALVTSRAPT